MLALTVNTYENIHTKFPNNQSKTLGDIHIYFGGLTFVEQFILFVTNRNTSVNEILTAFIRSYIMSSLYKCSVYNSSMEHM